MIIKTTKSLVPMQKKVSALATQVESLEIVDAASMQSGVVILSNINKYLDSIKESKEKLTKPAMETLKNIREMFKPLEQDFGVQKENLRQKMSLYQTQEVARVREEEAKIAARVKEGRGNLSIDTAVKKIEAIETVDKTVNTDVGTVQFVETKLFEVVDLSKVPIQYHLPNETEIRKAMKEGKELEGIRYYTQMVPRNYR
jgi:hypothetical protein